MPTITMSNPAANNDPFPATITGSYSPVLSGTLIKVTIRQEDDPTKTFDVDANVDGAGGWSAVKPTTLVPGKKYAVTATLISPGFATVNRTGIQN